MAPLPVCLCGGLWLVVVGVRVRRRRTADATVSLNVCSASVNKTKDSMSKWRFYLSDLV